MLKLLKIVCGLSLALLFLSACGPAHEDNRFGGNIAPGSANPSDPEAEAPEDDPVENVVEPAAVDFTYLVDNVFSKAAYNCVGCHAANAAFDFNDLATVETALVKGENMSGDTRADLTGNIFYVKTLDNYGDNNVFGGQRMPLGGDPISAADRALIEQWLANGGDI